MTPHRPSRIGWGSPPPWAALVLGAAPVMAASGNDPFLRQIEWCAQPSAHATARAADYIDAMVTDLEGHGWLRITPDNLAQHEDLLARLYAVPSDDEDEAMSLWIDNVRFEILERQAQHPYYVTLLHAEAPAVTSIAVFDDDVAELGLRISCYATTSDISAARALSELAGQPVSWDDLYADFTPISPYRPLSFDIAEYLPPAAPGETRVVEVTVHPALTALKGAPEDFPFAMMAKTSSALAAEALP